MISIKARQLINGLRRFATVAREHFDPGWESAKPYSRIPKQSFLSREFLPGGQLRNQPLDKMHEYFIQTYGKLVRFPSLLGRTPIVLCYDPDDIKRVYRHEGPWPYRKGLDALSHWRRNVRKDAFTKFFGLVDE